FRKPCEHSISTLRTSCQPGFVSTWFATKFSALHEAPARSERARTGKNSLPRLGLSRSEPRRESYHFANRAAVASAHLCPRPQRVAHWHAQYSSSPRRQSQRRTARRSSRLALIDVAAIGAS